MSTKYVVFEFRLGSSLHIEIATEFEIFIPSTYFDIICGLFVWEGMLSFDN